MRAQRIYKKLADDGSEVSHEPIYREEQMRDAISKLLQVVPVLKGVFSREICSLIRLYEVPLDTDELLDSIESVRFLVTRQFTYTDVKETMAEYHFERNLITFLDSRITSAHFQEDFFHELLHHCSGREISEDSRISRGGFRHIYPNLVRNAWLDEAMTEVLALLMLGRGPFGNNGAYYKERQFLLDLLNKIGIEVYFKRFLRAYLGSDAEYYTELMLAVEGILGNNAFLAMERKFVEF